MIHRWRMRHTLARYADGELPERERAAFVRHLERCPVCTMTLQRIRRTEDLLTQARLKPPPLSSQASRVLLDRALAASGVGPRQAQPLSFQAIAAPAAVLAGAVFCAFMVSHFRPPLPTPDPGNEEKTSAQASQGGNKIVVASFHLPINLIAPWERPGWVSFFSSSTSVHHPERAPRRRHLWRRLRLYAIHGRRNRLPDLPREQRCYAHRTYPPSTLLLLAAVGPEGAAPAPNLLAQTAIGFPLNTPSARPPAGHLVVVVTRPEPQLKVTVTKQDTEPTRLAQVESFRPNILGGGIWAHCSIVSDESGKEMSQRYTETVVYRGVLRASLTVETTSEPLDDDVIEGANE